ncbi:n-acetylglucosamine-induced protein [Anaeramoeba flamelloides]|uniref:N-acetylglucosamine-induced protein n=1 Tax=Anaeramoeba flamelloides TaxID=1746091 RepID=A0AAV8A2A8_9EUKA|nr:n-acetylglucosamine-induced protein [Anaeramoeba flamelloides]KAJ6229198.1 n-acetylglucosamine-induced protein [Anaeramoeba flamelloides]|eukprot:Anaeramoba_flamelloidesa1952_22.p1 GENE.a1952_22~~a1952_22.p1  ORF type:complete len:151 (-),score=23.64 a1952_22:196-648(-)
MIRGKIDSNPEVLNQLHQIHPWVPSGSQIRPSKSTLEIKRQEMSTNFYDINLFSEQLFGVGWSEAQNGKGKSKTFQPNKYPYDVSPKTHHYIIWYPYRNNFLTDEQITQDILEEIKCLVGSESGFDFCWYENPKMTIADIYHVQVFWTRF